MLLTTFSTEPFVNNNRDQTSYSYSDRYSKSGPKIFGRKWSGWTIFPGIFGPPDQFFHRTKISVTALFCQPGVVSHTCAKVLMS